MKKSKKLPVFFNCGLISIIMLCLLVCMNGWKGEGKTEYVGFPQSFADLAEKVRPAVVNISSTTTVTIAGSPFFHFFGQGQGAQSDQFFRNFFGQIPDRKLKQQSLGGPRTPARNEF